MGTVPPKHVGRAGEDQIVFKLSVILPTVSSKTFFFKKSSPSADSIGKPFDFISSTCFPMAASSTWKTASSENDLFMSSIDNEVIVAMEQEVLCCVVLGGSVGVKRTCDRQQTFSGDGGALSRCQWAQSGVSLRYRNESDD